MTRLTGKVALITGAASGIGAAAALRFAQEGARVMGGDIAGADTQRWRTGYGDDTRAVILDVTSDGDWAAAISDAMTRFGRLDILVNCAGGGRIEGDAPHDPESIGDDEWRRVMAVNLDGAMRGCRHAIPAIREGGGGGIVNVASRLALVGTPDGVAYGASKAALVQHTKSVAVHCASGPAPIRCNAVLPGPVDTPMMRALAGDATAKAGPPDASSVPLGRFAAADEIAGAIAFLASGEASYITGATLTVDGGLSAV